MTTIFGWLRFCRSRRFEAVRRVGFGDNRELRACRRHSFYGTLISLTAIAYSTTKFSITAKSSPETLLYVLVCIT